MAITRRNADLVKGTLRPVICGSAEAIIELRDVSERHGLYLVVSTSVNKKMDIHQYLKVFLITTEKIYIYIYADLPALAKYVAYHLCCCVAFFGRPLLQLLI